MEELSKALKKHWIRDESFVVAEMSSRRRRSGSLLPQTKPFGNIVWMDRSRDCGCLMYDIRNGEGGKKSPKVGFRNVPMIRDLAQKKLSCSGRKTGEC